MGKKKSHKTRDKHDSRHGGKPGSARGKNDLRNGRYGGPVQGSGVQNINYNALSAPSAPLALAVLPPVPPEFTGRQTEVDDLLTLLAPRPTPPPGDSAMPVPTTAVVAGLPGVGKTTLAVTAARRAVDDGWFTGVQMINLRGYDQTPVPSEQALDALLRSLGVPPEHIPPTRDERANLYRSQLDTLARQGDRLLIVADNASDPDQVKTLLPGTPVHRVLVTSRHTLTGLGARLVELRTLPPQGAVDLVRRALYVANPDDTRVDDDPKGAEDLVSACGYLPLALQIAASLLTADPDQPLAERAALLNEDGNRLAGLDDGSRAVRAAFEQSFRLLTPQQADQFRLLSLNPGPSISTKAASLLADRTEAETRTLLGALTRAHLVERVPEHRDRWQIHDLLRDYAAEEAQTHSQRSRDIRRRYHRAQSRLLEYYVRTVTSVNLWLNAEPGEEPSGLFATESEAMAWMSAEHSVLTALGHVANSGASATQLASALAPYLLQQRHFDTLDALASTVRDIARENNDRTSEAVSWDFLGYVAGELGRQEEAVAAYATARDIYLELGKKEDAADSAESMGSSLIDLHRYDEALTAAVYARDIYAELGKRADEADSWDSMAIALSGLERHAEALAAATRAREIAEEIDNSYILTNSWLHTASELRDLGRYDEATSAAEKAIALAVKDRNVRNQARTWNNLGLTRQALGRWDDAVDAFNTAYDLYVKGKLREGEGITWNNIGTAYRGAGRYEDAVDYARRSVAVFVEISDHHATGEASAELATSLTAAGADRAEIVAAWEHSARAYLEAKDERRAAESRARAREAGGESAG